MKDRSFYKLFFTLTFTIALRNVIVFTVNLADNVMLGSYAESAMSGVALVNQIQFLLQLMITGACEGAQIFISRAWGSSDNDTIKKMINLAVRAALVIALVVMLIVTISPEGVLGLLATSKEFVAEGAGYLRIIRFSYPIFALTTALIVANNGVETVRLGFITSIGALVVNVCLNYCLIFGNFGFPEMGARGAAVATLIARCVECLAVVVYTFRLDKKIGMRFGHMGDSAITANSISNTLFQIITVVTYASASCASVMISKVIGEGRAELVKPYARTFQLLFICIGVITSLLLFTFKDVILLAYGDISAESKAMALKFMTILSVTVIGTSYQMPCHTGVVRGGGDTSFVFKVDSIFMWGIVLPAAFVAAFVLKWPPEAVFFVLKCDQLIKCVVAFIKVNSFNWILNLRGAK